jgi:hypothetical protein
MIKTNLNEKIEFLNNKLKKLNDFDTNKKDLAVVCCYFNPCHYASKLKNYKLFREGIEGVGVKILTVELAFGEDCFELEGFEDILFLRTGEDNVMWQKERLLNIGIRQLINENYEKIAWLDADVVFENDNWANYLSQELDKYPLCQVFEEINFKKSENIEVSVKGCIKDLHERRSLSNMRSVTGFGWAARADILKKVMLFDFAILGGGDALISYASFFNHPHWRDYLSNLLVIKSMPWYLFQDYLEWAKKWGSLIKGRVGYVETKIKSLYHGEIKKRQYRLRDEILLKYAYNPRIDIMNGVNGIFEWNSDKLELHKEIKNYFYTRMEDD